MLLTILVAALLAALALLISPPHAHGNFVYWANGTTPGSIGRAKINGTGANNDFITGLDQPTGVAVDSKFIYWSDRAQPNRARQSGRHRRQPGLHHLRCHLAFRDRGHRQLRDLLGQPHRGQRHGRARQRRRQQSRRQLLRHRIGRRLWSGRRPELPLLARHIGWTPSDRPGALERRWSGSQLHPSRPTPVAASRSTAASCTGTGRQLDRDARRLGADPRIPGSFPPLPLTPAASR